MTAIAGPTASHRGGSGAPMVLLHGFTGSWRVWELVLADLERHHDVLAPTLPGHAGGPVAPHVDAVVATAEGRRRATSALTTRFDHIPPALVAHVINATAFCPGTQPFIDTARREGYHLDAERITWPVRVVWGTEDTLLPWPSTAARCRHDWLPHADWVELEGVGHCPQLDVPLEAAQLILGFTAG